MDLVGSASQTDSLNKVCTGQPFRSNGTSGTYGTVIVYTLVHSNGTSERLVPIQTGLVQSFSGWRLTCTGGAGGTHVLHAPSGDKFTLGKRFQNEYTVTSDNFGWQHLTFSATQKLDPNGNSLTFSYTDQSGGPPLLSSVSASDGRNISFTYALVAGANRLTQIASADGRSWLYSYHGNGALAAFVDPAGRRWEYQYHAASSAADFTVDWARAGHLSSIKRPQGGTTSFTYSMSEVWGRGHWWWEGMDPHQLYEFDSNNDYGPGSVSLASSRANWSLRVSTRSNSDGGTWSYSYSPSRAKGQYDTTTVAGPSGSETYRYFGEGFFGETGTWTNLLNWSFFFYNQGAAFTAPPSTPNAPIIRDVWKLGLLAQETRGTQTTDYVWQRHLHSAIFFVATSGVIGMRDEETYRPVLSSRTYTRDGVAYRTTYGSFDAHGNPGVVTEIGPNGGARTTTVSYLNDTAKWIIGKTKDEVVSSGASTYRSFDGNGNLLSLNRAGVTTSYTYAQGNIASTTFPRGLTHTYSNYHRGIARTDAQPEAVTISRTVSDSGFILSQTDGEGFTTAFTYDGAGRPTRVTPPAGNASVITYTATTTTETRGSLVQFTQFDAFGRPTRVETGGIPIAWAYDALGRKTFESARGYATFGDTFAYDALDRLIRISHTGDGSYRSFTYGAASGIPTIAIRDERGYVTIKRLRGYGDPQKNWVMSVDAPVSTASLTMERNAEGQVTQVTQGGLARSYGYDSRFYLTSAQHPETGTTTYGRDEAGNMISRKVGAGATSTYSYDGRNRLTAISYAGGTATASFTWWRTDKQKTNTRGTVTRSMAYDGNRNLTNETLLVDGVSMTAGFEYTANDHVSAIVYPVLGRRVTFTPDVLGRPTSVAVPFGGMFGVAYWPNGQIYDVAYAGGSRVTYGMNTREWTNSITVRTGDGVARVSSELVYDVAGNLLGVSDSVDTSYNRTYSYDAVDRLTSASGPWGGGAVSYSDSGNITSYTLGSQARTYSYDTQNRLANVSWPSTSVSYGYDAEGNALPSGSGHAYDAASDLVQTGSGRSNLYDGNHLRVRTSEAGVTTYEFRSVTGALLAQWRKQAGYYDRLKEHINVAGKELAEQQTDFLGATQQPVSWLFLQPDTLGSPLTSTWAGGGLLFKENYQPYGTQLNGTAAGYTTGTFGGLRQDSADLAYAGRRYYDPRIGRFLAIDPVEFQEDHLHSFNRYAYANNNPNKFKDPQGRFPVLALLPPALEGLMAWAGSSAGAAAVGTAAGVGLGVMLNANSQPNPGSVASPGASVPDLPSDLVGTQDKKSGPQGNRHNSGPLDPKSGGTSDAQKDFDKLTGGKSGSAPAGSKYPPGTQIGENGVALRPGQGNAGPRIDIPSNGSKPHETLHY